MSGDKFWSSGAGSYRVSESQYIETAIHTSYGAPAGKEYTFQFRIEYGVWYSSRWDNGKRVEYEVWRKVR
jgi:hypothetical protein